jgi:hypothetical protein
MKSNISSGFCPFAREFEQPETRVAEKMIAANRPEWYQCHHRCRNNQQMLKASH